MSIPATIQDDIEEGLGLSVSHRTLNGSTIIKYDDGDTIRIPMESIISKYKDLLDQYITSQVCDDSDKLEYRFQPKKFSLDMYGTTQYWSIILYINECHSIVDFDLDEIKFIKPEVMDTLINEIMILENLL